MIQLTQPSGSKSQLDNIASVELVRLFIQEEWFTILHQANKCGKRWNLPSWNFSHVNHIVRFLSSTMMINYIKAFFKNFTSNSIIRCDLNRFLRKHIIQRETDWLQFKWHWHFQVHHFFLLPLFRTINFSTFLTQFFPTFWK